jgi:hypothetical protein
MFISSFFKTSHKNLCFSFQLTTFPFFFKGLYPYDNIISCDHVVIVTWEFFEMKVPDIIKARVFDWCMNCDFDILGKGSPHGQN